MFTVRYGAQAEERVEHRTYNTKLHNQMAHSHSTYTLPHLIQIRWNTS